jgi:hypothetical protein
MRVCIKKNRKTSQPHPADWPWSSYNLGLNDEETWLRRDEVIKWFGSKNEFFKLHQQERPPRL